MNWSEVLINAAISAEQGLLESGKLGLVAEIDPELAAEQSIRIAQALVKKLREIIG